MEKFDLERHAHLRQQPFQAPDRYFDDLGMRVQKRVAQKHGRTSVMPLPAVWALRLALPALALAFGLFWWASPEQKMLGQANNTGAEAIIAQVSDEEIAAYLSEDASEQEIYDVAFSENAVSSSEDLLLEEVEVEDLENYF